MPRMRWAMPSLESSVTALRQAASAADQSHPSQKWTRPSDVCVSARSGASRMAWFAASRARGDISSGGVAVLQQRADRLFKNGNSDYAAGDAVFLAAFANLAEYNNAAATASSFLTLNTVFDNRTALIVDPPDGRIPRRRPGRSKEGEPLPLRAPRRSNRGEPSPRICRIRCAASRGAHHDCSSVPIPAITRSFRLQGTSCSTSKPTFASSRWTIVHTRNRVCRRCSETREGDGKGTRWSSIRRTVHA
jgi:hypothetical protein